jgi:hydrogenase expression/formation protein HypC
MCLAVPGRIIDIQEDSGPARTGTVDFQGSRVEVSLALVPDASAGDWVLVHAGFAISTLNEAEARETWQYLEEAGLLEDQEP